MKFEETWVYIYKKKKRRNLYNKRPSNILYEL